MDISIKLFDQAAVVVIVGSIDALTASRVTNGLNTCIDGGRKQIVMDLGQVDFMSSSGLQAIMAALKRCRQQGGDLYLAAAQPGVEKVLTMSGFGAIMRIFSTVDEALASF